MPENRKPPGLIPTHGGYRDLKSYQMSEIVYDAAVLFIRQTTSSTSSFARLKKAS